MHFNLIKLNRLECGFEALTKPLYCSWLSPYAQSPQLGQSLQNLAWQTLPFEKKLCRKAFKQNFGLKLPSSANITVAMALYNRTPRFKSSYSQQIKSTQANYDSALLAQPKAHFNSLRTANQIVELQDATQKSVNKTHWACCGLQLISASWACEQLIKSLSARRSAKATLYRFIRDVAALMNLWQSACPLKGLRVSACGRLSKTKKGMAQQINLSIGKVPTSTVKEKVDYSQGFVKTRLGTVGLKVWLCFR